MKLRINMKYDDWKNIENNSTGLPMMNNELIETIAKLASNEDVDVILTIESNPEYILNFDHTQNLFIELKIES